MTCVSAPLRHCLLLAAALCYLLSSLRAHAVTTSWNTNSSGLFTAAANWNNGAPNSDDTAVFNRGSGVAYTVTFPGGSIFDPPPIYTVDYLRVLTNEVSFVYNSSPFLTVPSLSVASPADDAIIIGQNSGDAAILNTTLSNVAGSRAWVGYFAGAQGTLNVAGGRFDMNGALDIGGSGNGTMNVLFGGRVESFNTNIARNETSTGHVTVSGAGSQWIESGDLNVGAFGDGTLVIQGGGSLSTDTHNRSSSLGREVGSSGAAMVTGAGSIWNSGALEIGKFGTGTLTIEAGGAVTRGAISGFNSDVGSESGSHGAVTVTGAGSTWNSGVLDVGRFGTGTLTIEAGGAVTSFGSFVGDQPGSNGAVTVRGANSNWTVELPIDVGRFGAGALTIEAGGAVSSEAGNVGGETGSNGAVIITGAGAAWTNKFSLSVGRHGTGTLTIEAGGSASNGAGVIGGLGATGTATVSGSGSTWANTTLHVGRFGSGTLNITGGGMVTNTSADVGTEVGGRGMVTVDGPGSTWVSSGDLTIGSASAESSAFKDIVLVSNDGAVSVDGLLVVEEFGSVAGNSAFAATVINRGEVQPGLNPGSLMGVSPGTLDVEGNYFQGAAGRLNVRLAGTSPETQYDQLHVAGAITLHGTLTIALANSFVPTAGDAFDILDWGNLSGAFSTILLPALDAGLSWNTSQLYVNGVISVVGPPTFTADFDADGDVDSDDLEQWQGDFGANAFSDADDDGDSDGADFLAWQRQVGSGVVAVNASAVVPEPATPLLLGVGVAWSLVGRARSGSK